MLCIYCIVFKGEKMMVYNKIICLLDNEQYNVQVKGV